MNHKNFINLLGFCEEEDPFTRMMVLEYAPNGTLYENLHGMNKLLYLFNDAVQHNFSSILLAIFTAADDFEHIGWRGRTRIIMGLAYCIQQMHELSPPVVHPDLQSSSILLTEDGAAKVHVSAKSR
jgi:serine/threonine protein kinase